MAFLTIAKCILNNNSKSNIQVFTMKNPSNDQNYSLFYFQNIIIIIIYNIYNN